ncbi:hypothetical protein [bacterium endosymbiont of Bathymodiolus sp. 5 South]|jgi:hypothetical protein|uniref:hypothetical protein n=1 Tax=bacterium endosymbiont of Bathymodiolus sp. 5 South TaxID=1181670 RepID=UPI0010BC801C|nr:hypothetical protein [bacterium endosymbiont of Bathymodiolus sp. 5 South]CAC9437801.1 hypothetical protein [uncultured Gammaproteobacteria bacterium]SSC08557.1 hypothetical protein BTURTLESOX_172 [bacterium endosymbiont of Bathymodiolus sp. 5 South]VVM17219.1 hypothetical protein BSPWISOXPB_10161 [uncultured Gammaproteobacteria bacterium]VVM18907.1 hypothetical protein BSPWISOXPB_10149 [uncultured Gammaproteobacteria bacterium]
MLKTLKNIILVDETQPLEQIKKQYKSKTYWFLGLSWLVSFLLIWIIPQDIMQHNWAKNFVNFMGAIVPMVDGLENIRLYGSSDPHKAHLIVLPHISFYYAVLWAYAWVSVPYVLSLTKGNFIFNFDEEKPIGFKKIKNMLYNNKFRYYLSFLVIILIVFFAYISSEASTNWFKVRYIYSYSIGSFGFIFTSLAVYVSVTFLQTHFLIKQQEKQHAN